MYYFLKQLMIPHWDHILQGSSKFWGMQYTYNFIQIIETKSIKCMELIEKLGCWLLVDQQFLFLIEP